MKKLLLVAFSILIMSITGHTQAYQEVSCSAYGSDANSCDQCFEGGSKYVGDVFAVADVFNAGSNDRLYFDDENPIVYSFQSLNTNTSWFVSDNLLQYPDTFVWNTYQNRLVHQFKAGTSERFLETQPGKGIRLQSVATDTVSPNNPAFKFTFISKYRTYDGAIGGLEEHRECIFYKPNYCGDGILDTGNGEVCDPNDPNATGHGNGGCDTNTCQPIETPTCNALTVTPVSGINPVTSNVTCEGYKVDTFRIDCGNGTELNGNGSGIGTEQFSGTCTYTDEGVYTPTCYVNDSATTSNTCQSTVTVTDPLPAISIDKVDQNSSDLDGSIGNDEQTVNAGEAAVFRITVTNTGAEALKDIALTDARSLSCASQGTVNLAGKTFTNQNGSAVSISFGGNGNHNDNILDVGETFTYLCSEPNTQEDYTNTASVNGTGVISEDPANATDTSEVFLGKEFDLALVKVVAGSQTVFSSGDIITYAITVYNQGDIDASGVIVTDYIPAGFTLEDGSWDLVGNQAARNIGDVAAGGQKTVNIRLKVGDNVSGNVVNWAEISRDDISGDYTDIDSTADSNNNNDCHGRLTRVQGVSASDDNRTNGTGDSNNNGCNTGEDEDDHDPAAVTISDAKIAIVKYSANAADLDGNTSDSNVTNDTQTVNEDDRAVFKIKVTNTGSDDLNNIVLTDAVAPNCGGTVTLPGTYPSTWSNFTTTANGNVLKPGETFEYTCIKEDTSENYTNTAAVDANSVVTGDAVPQVSDVTQVRVELPFDLALVKTVASNGGTNFEPGELVTFTISVINQGSVDATNVQVVDYIPAGLELADSNWTLAGTTATRGVGNVNVGETRSLDITLRVASTATSGTVTNWAEISSADGGDDCDSTPDSDQTNDTFSGDNNVGDGCNPGGDEDDHDPATITINTPIFDLALRKIVTGSATSFTTGDVIPFAVTVINQGSVDATNVVVTDYIPAGLELTDSNWTLAGTNATRTVASLPAGGSVTLGLNLTVASTATAGDITNWAEISSADGGDDCDSTPDSDQTNDTFSGDNNVGDGCNPGGDEDDHDPATITIAPGVFDLALIKTVTGSATSFAPGDTLTYNITVTNQGTVDATNVVVTDYVPAGMTIASGASTFTMNIDSLAAGQQATVTTQVFTIADNATAGDITNWAEISSADGGDDCDSTPDSDQTNDTFSGDNNVGDGCNPGGDEDDHDPATITVLPGDFDLALTKTMTATTTNFVPGDIIPFTITVINQGAVDATNVVVTDYIPAGLELADSNWAASGTNATRTIAALAAGASQPLTLNLKVKADATAGDTINWAEISSADGGIDIDSTPDSDNTNDCHGGLGRDAVSASDDDRTDGTGDANGNNNCDAGEDEDDHDPALVTIVVSKTPSIAIDKVDANSGDLDGNEGNDTQKINKGADAVFEITVTNNGTEDLKNVSVEDALATACSLSEAATLTKIQAIGNGDTIFNVGESFTYTCTDEGVTTAYTNEAIAKAVGVDNGTPVEAKDDTRITIKSSGGSSGSTAKCTGITVVGNQVTCMGNSKVNSYKVDCGDGTVHYEGNTSNTSSATFTCGDGTAPVTGAKCYVHKDYISSDRYESVAWKNRTTCNQRATDYTPVCGNGILDAGEQCEALNNDDGGYGSLPNNLCTSTCRIKSTVLNPTDPEDRPTITIPNGGEINFLPQGKVIMGNGMNAYDAFGESPRIYNNSDYDLNLGALCVVQTRGTSLDTPTRGSEQCKNFRGTLYPYDTVTFTELGGSLAYTGNTSGMSSGQTYDDNNLQLTVKETASSPTLVNAYFAADLEVRVAKPTIVTVGGGTTYVSNTENISDTNTLATSADSDGNRFVDTTNRNFEGVSISNTASGSALSSNNTESQITDDLVSGKIESEQNEYKDAVQDTVTDAGSSNHKTLGDALENYNGIRNVYIVDGNLTVTDGDLTGELTAPTTYVVNGDLIINDDIESNQNIAFVVRGGEIIVKSNVKTLDGTYISIDGTIGGEISNEKLVVNGSLYGNINPLVNSRQYVQEEANGQIGAGTVVSFGSSIFKKPAPLVGQFVGEYLDSKKVAN